ncbi:MAG TPA: hypothetical protein PLH57_05950 [Oligoflexia bacterium]|nr:hypothetical protein [Oligoflexia bacterium]
MGLLRRFIFIAGFAVASTLGQASEVGCDIYLILSELTIKVEEGAGFRVVGRTADGKHGTLIVELGADKKRKFFKTTSSENQEIVAALFGDGHGEGAMADREFASSRLFAHVGWEGSTRVRRAELKMRDGRVEKGVLVDEVPGESLATIQKRDRGAYNKILRSPEYKQAAEEATLIQFVTGNIDWISYREGQGIDLLSENVMVFEDPVTKRYSIRFIDNGASFTKTQAVDAAATPREGLSLGERLKRLQLLHVQFEKKLPQVFYPLLDLEDMSSTTQKLLIKLAEFSDEELTQLLAKSPTLNDNDINGAIARIRYLEERFIERRPEIQMARNDYPPDINVRDNDDITSGRAQREATVDLELETPIVGESPAKGRLPVKSDFTDDPSVRIVGEVARVQKKNKNVVYKVEIDGQTHYFKPKSGENPLIGESFLGKFEKGMMADREVFASLVYQKAGWSEVPRVKKVKIKVDGELEEGALVQGLPGKTIREFGTKRFDEMIEGQADYRRSRERALILSVVTGNEDWYRIKSNRNAHENAGNLLLEVDPEDPLLYNYYWIDSGLSFPRRSRRSNTRLPGAQSSQYLAEQFGHLWPLLLDLDTLDSGTIDLIKELSKVSFVEWRELAKELPTITQTDIEGMMIRVNYLNRRFVLNDPEFQVTQPMREAWHKKRVSKRILPGRTVKADSDDTTLTPTQRRTDTHQVDTSESTQSAFDNEPTKAGPRPGDNDGTPDHRAR